jgi:AcrR family transcriptional regulator
MMNMSMPDPRTDHDADAPAPEAPPRKRAGRRPGQSGTREAIITAARGAFAKRGYDGVTLREVASRARVDPALIRHYFGDKKGLFAESIQLPWDGEALVAAIMYGDPDAIGERVVRRFLEVWDPPESQHVLITMIRTVASHGRSETVVRELITNRMVAPVAHALDRPDPELRTTLAGAMLVGLAMQRYVAHIEPFASMDADVAARIVGPTIQRFLTDPLPTP